MAKNQDGMKAGLGENMAFNDQPFTLTLVTPVKLPSSQTLEDLEDPPEFKLHMVALKAKFLPNLRGLIFPRMVYEQFKRLVVTPLLTYYHDPTAAIRLRGARCASFDMPKVIFPHGAPIWKITFLPDELLPMGFDAAGVFGRGVLSRKYYPTDLLSPQHKGQTPALFVGHRNPNYVIPKDDKAPGNCKVQFNDTTPAQVPNAKGKMPLKTKLVAPKAVTATATGTATVTAPSPPQACQRGMLKLSITGAAELNRRLVRHNISVADVVLPHGSPFQAGPVDMQYNMYVPDLSQVLFTVHEHTKLIVSIVSTIYQPNLPEAALATMGSEECPKFVLPPDVLPVDPNRMGPRFLPVRYLPEFCDAGCVFPPGSLPDWVFQGDMRKHYELEQYHYSMTPPVFVGRRKIQQSADGIEGDYTSELLATQMGKMAITSPLPQPTPSPPQFTFAEGAKRTREFKEAASGGKAKGFVLFESDHVPRGAIRTDAFSGYLMGCLFKITPIALSESPITFGTVNDIRSATELSEDGDFQFLPAEAQPKFNAEEGEGEGEEAEGEVAEGEVAEVAESEQAEEEETESEEAESEQAEEEETESEEVEAEGEGEEAKYVESLDSNDYDEYELEEYEDEETDGDMDISVEFQDDTPDEDAEQAVNKTYNMHAAPKNTDDTDFYDSDATVLFGSNVRKVYSVFTVDSRLDDIAEAAGDLNTARLEVIVSASEMPGIDVERAREQFRQVLQCRNEIRANMIARIDAHTNKMTTDNQHLLASPAPAATNNRGQRKICSHCRKYH